MMHKIIFIASLIIFIHTHTHAQTPEGNTRVDQALENLADNNEDDGTEDDAYIQFFENRQQHKLNINSCTAEDLKEFYFLTPLQIANLINYRQKLGNFINVYELQSIPAWDASTVKKMLPFVTLGNSVSIFNNLNTQLTQGRHSLLLRQTRIIQQSRGYTTNTGNFYQGSPDRLFFRYKYNYKNTLQYGLLGEKDAGETFGFGKKKLGTDFTSFHFFIKGKNKLKTLALGDFTVNFGQGLTSWQVLGFRKTADAMQLKRQSPTIRPYASLGEFNFHRGIGMVWGNKNINVTAFGSLRNIDGNLVIDTLNNEDFFSSIQTSGLHRTNNEIADRRAIQQASAGAQIAYEKNNLKIAAHAVGYKFSKEFNKGNEPYNLYAINGDTWGNAAIEASYTYKNLHFFTEQALAYNKSYASVNGLLVSLHKTADLSLFYRNISSKYQVLYSTAFTESTLPTNETGLYTGLTVRPKTNLRFDFYTDVYRFPFIKYLTDAPTNGSDYFAQVDWKYQKKTEIYIRYRQEAKPRNLSNSNLVTNEVLPVNRKNLRLHISQKLDEKWSMRLRTELVRYVHESVKENGFMQFVDLIYKPLLNPWSANMRLAWFETDGYNSRIYAFENDVQYSFSIPPQFGKGVRYYLNLNYDWRLKGEKKVKLWLRWAENIYERQTSIGSGLDEIRGNRRSELKLQAMIEL
jgi:hypothetical protein